MYSIEELVNDFRKQGGYRGSILSREDRLATLGLSSNS
jgi:hypothetical protein